jgi:hypothetical protein
MKENFLRCLCYFYQRKNQYLIFILSVKSKTFHQDFRNQKDVFVTKDNNYKNKIK